jgi:heterodisulfide reductase subunit A-like polyferredoxin
MQEKDLSRRGFLTKMTGIGAFAIAGALLIANTGCNDLASGFGTFSVNGNKCTGCKDCFKACSHNAFSISGDVTVISSSRCTGCGKCVSYCKQNAIYQS